MNSVPSSPKKVAILGSTGSIGESALKVARDVPDRMEVVALAAHRSSSKILNQAAEFDVKQIVLTDELAAKEAG
ncbi:MAG: 1-deoxy-D-xylulose-5-phosphate reductoisomerase, partial [Verrucomicrobiota bacterium]